jgi:hypothetical protein
MDARFYNTEDLNIQQLANDLENVYRAQGYQVQQVGGQDQILVQLKKGGDFETLIGMGVALSVIIQKTAGGVLAMLGQQKWVDKAAAGAVGAVGLVVPVLLPLAVTAGVGALRQMSLANQVLNVVDGLVRQQRPGIQGGPIPVQLIPQVQQWAPPSYAPPPPMYIPSQPQYLPPPQPQVVVSQPAPSPAPAPAKLRCPNCNTPYEAGDTFCTGCGKSLKTLCPNCQAELKPDASFCPKCGASTFQSTTATQTARPALTPAPQQYVPPTVTYTPSTPTYTPPPAQPKSTPPPQPQPYVPPVPQQPPVVPQPRVTIVPGTSSQQPPAAPKTPPRQEEPYYIPSKQPSPPDAPTVASTKVSPPQPPKQEEPYYVPSTQASTIPNQSTPQAQTPPKPIVAKPASEPAYDAKAIWGNLTFSDGKQVNISGERAVVGRYDHDLGGINPDVDLAGMQGAETVSRVHAAFEHVGSTYTLMDLNSTNTTRVNGKRLEPDKATPINDGDTIQFGKVTCTFKRA